MKIHEPQSTQNDNFSINFYFQSSSIFLFKNYFSANTETLYFINDLFYVK